MLVLWYSWGTDLSLVGYNGFGGLLGTYPITRKED